ncbi:LOB domain-containing protein 20-like [Impatiens glandulifera]|uniref:LOB domain-containing protein 20-like n=1 Tax=Impatiens glandulifera TaxID=253017 RepID=UPI001FB161CD|nr:LOB domain-containing protein 20-like [Impatiens glandulifera]
MENPTRGGGGRRKGSKTRRVEAVVDGELVSVVAGAPCGACKFLRRKCISGCIFAPYFGMDQGAARFAAVHKVFGASNVSKLLQHIPVNRRQDAAVTISYEAQARLSDPIYGCVSTIFALQQQVINLQAELAMVQSQLLSNRFVVANAINNCQQQQFQHNHFHQQHQQQDHYSLGLRLLQPAYSNNNNSSTSNNQQPRAFNSNFDFIGDTMDPSSYSFDPLRLSHQLTNDDEEEEEESRRGGIC